jgi:hypothetical protein
MLIELKREIKKAHGQIRLSELSLKLNVQPSVIEGMLVSLYGRDVLNSSLDPCSTHIGCASCGGSCPFSKAG